MATTVSLDDMRDKLLTLDQARAELGKTEPLSTKDINSESTVSFDLKDGWEQTLDALSDGSVVGATMRINDEEFQMTKGAALQAAANVGLPGTFVRKTPGSLIRPQLNWHYTSGLGSAAYKALVVDGTVRAFTKPSITPFSNLALLDQALKGIDAYYGADTEVLVDYKFGNNLAKTDVRLIIPSASRVITGTHMNDLPSGAQDEWAAGIHLSNSIIGKGFTSLDTYLFRWWCTNGATTTLESVGTWSRRSNGQTEDDVYAWARESVEEVLGGMEHRFDEVQSLAKTNISGNVTDFLRQIFAEYKVPVTQRAQVMAELHNISGHITMYHVMQALTRLANDPNLGAARADRIMRIGGAMPTTTFDNIKAKVWAEGHTAEDDNNPYEVVVA